MVRPHMQYGCMRAQSVADRTSSHTQAALPSLRQRVVPLFETLDDLDRAGDTMRRLLGLPWYRQQLR